MPSIIIAGKSGNGKTYSLQSLDLSKTLIINVLGKKPSFMLKGRKDWVPREAGKGNVIVESNANNVRGIVATAAERGFERVIIDDIGYVMTTEFMNRVNEKGFGKFNDIAEQIWDLIGEANKQDINIYFFFHTEPKEEGFTGIKTIGKLLDNQICIEGMSTVVLIARRTSDGEYVFQTQTSGSDVAKSPAGMFEDEFIPNRLDLVDKAMNRFYGIG